MHQWALLKTNTKTKTTHHTYKIGYVYLRRNRGVFWSLSHRAPCLLRLSKHSYTMCAYIKLVHAINTEEVKNIGRKINVDKSRSEPWERNQKREYGVQRPYSLWSHASLYHDASSLTYNCDSGDLMPLCWVPLSFGCMSPDLWTASDVTDMEGLWKQQSSQQIQGTAVSKIL